MRGAEPVLHEGVVAGLPEVEEELAVGADDIVALMGRFVLREEAGAREHLGRGLGAVDLPLERPVVEGGEAVVVAVVLLELSWNLWGFLGGLWRVERRGVGRGEDGFHGALDSSRGCF